MTDDADPPNEEEPDPTLGKITGSLPKPGELDSPSRLADNFSHEPTRRLKKPPRRTRVVLADPRQRAHNLRALVELEEQTSWGEILIKDLIREQARAAIMLALFVMLTLGALPLAFYFSPSFANLRVAGVPLAWLLLAILPFPLLLVVGLWYNRLAERHERNFVDMVEN